jgi:hypothetical protein
MGFDASALRGGLDAWRAVAGEARAPVPAGA